MSKLDVLTKSLVGAYTEKLNQQQQEELMACLEILADDARYNKFKNHFLEEGKYRRELYPKHMSFFKASADYKEVFFLAGNRCISPWTYIETDQSKIRSLEAFSLKECNVLSWDGESQCVSRASGGILKGIEPMFRFVLDNGEFFDCTRKHRLLTSSGWMQIDQLVSLSSGLRLRKTPEDYECYCVSDGYLCDQPLLSQEGISREQLPSQADAQEPFHLVWSLEDVGEHISKYIQTLRFPVHLSSLNEDPKLLALISQFQAAKTDTHVLPLSDHTLSLHQLLSVLASLLQSDAELLHDLQTYEACPDLQQLSAHAFLDKHGVRYEEDQSYLQSHTLQGLGLDIQELHCGGSYTDIYSPLDHPSLVGGKRIVSIAPLGLQPVIDSTVDKYKCYFSAGVIHHNTGKTVAGAYATTCHATGLYPDWWEGKRYKRPTLIWVGGDTATTVRDILQQELIGDMNDIGSGMIPKELILVDQCKTRRNVPEAMEIIRVRHITGGVTTIVLKTYEQGRATWQGTAVDLIWVDEECPEDVYGEALIRLMTTEGLLMTTFTPLRGVTPLVLSALDNSQDSEAEYPKWVELCTWDDVPHLTEEEKAKTLANTPPQLRDARSKGIPTVGDGLVYPLDPKMFVVDDFQIPKHHQRLYAMDVGWHNTAALWGAWDKDNDIKYIYSEHKQGLVEPIVHAQAIKARGKISGVIDPAARGRSQVDGQKLFDIYGLPEAKGGLGLDIITANNAVESGIFSVWERLSSGRLKIFASCTGLLRELSLYHRDKNGQIVKKNDHLADCLRYLENAEVSDWKYLQDHHVRKKVVDMNKYVSGYY